MFHKLQYEVTFPSTGRTLKNDVTFDAGFMVITGRNETGKSMIFEMLRYLLFGAQALRGKGDDYKTLTATGEVTIKSERYRIVRTARKAELFRGTEHIATGVSTVNQAIVRLMGFGMSVFDVACSINQGEVERLGLMGASERKRLIDTTLGIDALDLVAKWGMEEAKVITAQAVGVRANMIPPTLPEQPADYVPSVEIDIPTAEAEASELATITGWLSHTVPQPQRPVTKIDLPAENLRLFAAKRAEKRNAVAALQAQLAVLPTEAPYTVEALDAAALGWAARDAYWAAHTWLTAHPQPRWTREALLVYRDDYTAITNIYDRGRLAEEIKIATAKGSKPCPHCGEEILNEAGLIEELQASHDALIVPNDNFVPKVPPVNAASIDRELAYCASFDHAQWEVMSAVPFASEPTIPPHKIAGLRLAVEQIATRLPLQAQLNAEKVAFDAMPDYEAMLVEREAYEAASQRFVVDNQAYEAWKVEHGQKMARQLVLKGADARLAALRVSHTVAKAYEWAMETYTTAAERYERLGVEASALEAQASEHRKVRDVMNVLRALIKQHILPSLSKVASHLLHNMTSGERSHVFIDEDFNILVDKQDLDTLSGSGKAVAGLAVRIALGQVLTNRVISVLMADEIDGSFDDFRAAGTATVLEALASSISQVMLISHKDVEAEKRLEIMS
jgi:hypothetical protein